MFQSSAKAREALLIDLEVGTILQAPTDPLVSRRYIESHPFAEISGKFVIVGPDAAKVAGGSGGTSYALYEIEDEVGGVFRLRRES